jgi:4-carboxymuconolactone decarboxylase
MAKKTIEDSFNAGMKRRREVLGDAWVDLSIKTKTDFNADFLNLITRYAWDDIWNRPGLQRKTRRMLVLGMTIAQGRWEEYCLHLRAALEQKDLTLDEIKEVLMQSAIYCGVPAANTAFKEARHIIADLAALKAARSTKKAPSSTPNATVKKVVRTPKKQ